MATLTQLEYVVAVDQTKHFGKAAKLCHVSQPSLSLLIQKLEDELGVIIFDRSQKPVLPTSKGQRIITQARRVLEESRKLQAIADDTGALIGELRVGIIPTLAPYLMPLFVEVFSRKYPGVQLFIDEYRTDEIVNLLNDERIDAGILATPLYESGIKEKVLFYEPFYLFVGKGHPLYGKARVQEAQLKSQDIWLLTEGHCLRNQALKVCSGGQAKNLLHNVHFESGNLETLKNLVRFSGGATILPYLAVSFTDESIRKMIKTFTKPVPTREVSLVYSRKDLKADLLDALHQTIVDSLPAPLAKLKGGTTDVIDISAESI